MGEEIRQDNNEISEDTPVERDAASAETDNLVAETKAPKNGFWKEVREWVIALAVAVLVALLIRTFLFTLIRVDGSSMESTLHTGERLFVSVLDVKLSGVDRNDVVICHYPYDPDRVTQGLFGLPTETNYVKRVRGVPGDIVERKNTVTYINGEAVDAGNDKSAMYPNGHPDDYEAYTLGEDEYFVVGDSVYNSHDSRDWNDRNPSRDVGPITGDMIMGRVRLVFWPLSEIRSVE